MGCKFFQQKTIKKKKFKATFYGSFVLALEGVGKGEGGSSVGMIYCVEVWEGRGEGGRGKLCGYDILCRGLGGEGGKGEGERGKFRFLE